MQLTATYGRASILLPDKGGELCNWLQNSFNLGEWTPDVNVPTWMTGQRFSNETWHHANTALPIPNYPPPPRLRLNSLYVPNGAIRWSRGLFAVTKKNLDKILEDIGASSEPTPLEFYVDDGGGHTMFQPMWMLAPLIGKTGGDDLRLIVLVDARYWWQFHHLADDVEFDHTTTWYDLFRDILAAIPGSHTAPSDIDSRYLSPDWVSFQRNRENAAMLLESAAWSVNRRVIYDGQTNKITLQSVADAYSLATEYYQDARDQGVGFAGFSSEASF